ncbi:MAG TPA: nuclear transport factor 2 family protein [Acidimicrobiales bacterium]|nr:nuclear transport factor 2 family protein [Acidimicrobiales bacterium]
MTEGAGPVDARQVVERYWAAAEGRDWVRFAALVADDVVYEVPQTRERVRGRDAYVRFNAEFPGDWHIVVERVVADADGRRAVSQVTSTLEGSVETGLCFFEIDDAGRVVRLTDWWPEPYDPPSDRAHLVERY